MSIVESEILVAKIIDRLAQNGVRTVTISTIDFFPTLEQESIDAFMETIRWLQSEGIIRTGEIPRVLGQHRDFKIICVLTAFGFSLLDQKFGNTGSMGKAVQKVSSGTEGYAKAGELIGGILGALTKSISGG